MEVMSNEELEAMQMMTSEAHARMRYVERFVEQTIDDNPHVRQRHADGLAGRSGRTSCGSSASRPRSDLGDHRDDSAVDAAGPDDAQRQAHARSRPRRRLRADLRRCWSARRPTSTKAIKLAYREILTREPTADELAEAQVDPGRRRQPLDGMADLRWVLFNCHEFRFLP